MSTMCYEIECPQCKYPSAYYELNCRSGEEYTLCSNCGFSYTSADGEKKGRGAYRIKYKDGNGTVGRFTGTTNIKDFIKQLKKYKNKLNLKETYITRWNNKKKEFKKYTGEYLVERKI